MSFGIADNVRSEVRECTPELLNEALDSPRVAKVCAKLEDALEAFRRGELTKDEYETLKGQLKKRLPPLTPHATFKNRRRKNEEAIPSGLSMYDLDHIPNPREKWEEIAPRKEELGIVFAHITPSTEGLRLVFVIPQGMSLAEAQAWMAEQLGDTQYDACVKDYARCSFLVPREYVLYMSERLFDVPQSITELSSAQHSYPLRTSCSSPLQRDSCETGTPQADATNTPPRAGEVSEGRRGELSSALLHTPSASLVPLQEGQHENNPCQSVKSVVQGYPETYDGIPHTQIVETLEEQMGGRPEHGSRNNFIFSMACHLRYVCDDDPDWIAQVLPTYGEGREKWMASIRSACARNQTQQMPRIMRRTLAICKERLNSEIINQNSESPQMPKRLPPLIGLLTSKVPPLMKPAVANAVFPALGAHLGEVKFIYVDNTEKSACFMCCLLAKMSSGKSAVNKPIEYILADIVEKDDENRRREQEWKESTNQKGANKEKPQRPQDLCIQVLVSDMTNAAFVQRLKDARGKFLYTCMDEIELLDQLKTSTRGNQVSQIIRLAFDCGMYGQERVGTSSVTARVKVKWNWNASSTIQKGKHYFRNALADGTLSRINVCTIETESGGDLPVYGTYDEKFAADLKPYIDNMNQAKGVIRCAEAEKLALQLIKENRDIAQQCDDEVFESLSYRANVIAYLKAMTLYVANGCQWEKSFEDFVRWSERYDLWCKMKFFGENLKTEMERENQVGNKGPQNMLQMLPNRFSYEEAQEMRRSCGKDLNAKAMLYSWVKRKYIVWDELTKQYCKTKKYLKRE